MQAITVLFYSCSGSDFCKGTSFALGGVCSVFSILWFTLSGLENKLRMVLHHLLLQRPGSFWIRMRVAWRVSLRCLSKFGCKKTFDLHADLADIIHMCGPGSPGLMGRVLSYEQQNRLYERNQMQSLQLEFCFSHHSLRMISRSFPLRLLAVSLSQRMKPGQPGQPLPISLFAQSEVLKKNDQNL